MAQNIAQFTSLEIDDLPRFFQDLWPQVTASTKTALLVELKPYLNRCATLLTELEPQLFSSRTTEKHQSPTAPIRQLHSAAKSSSSSCGQVFPPTCHSSTAPESQVNATSPAPECTATLSPTSQPILRQTVQETLPAERESIVSSRFLPGLPSEVETILCSTTAERFFQRKGEASPELYSALCQGVDNLWLHAIEQRFRYLGLYNLQCLLTEHGDGNTFYISPLSAKKRIVDAAAHYNPNVSKEKVRVDITQYLERGKKYWDLMDKFSVGLVVSLAPDYINHYERRMTKANHEAFMLELTKGGANAIVHLLEITAQQNLDWICRQYWVWFNGHKRKRGLGDAETISETRHQYRTNKRRRLPAAEIDHGLRNETISTALESFLPSPNHYLDVLACTALSSAAAQNRQPPGNSLASHFVPNPMSVTSTNFDHFFGGGNTNVYGDANSFNTGLDVNVNAQVVDGTLYDPNTFSADTNNNSNPLGTGLDVNVNAQVVNGTLYNPDTLAADANNDLDAFSTGLDVNVNAQVVNGTTYYPDALSADTNSNLNSFVADLDINVNAHAMHGNYLNGSSTDSNSNCMSFSKNKPGLNFFEIAT